MGVTPGIFRDSAVFIPSVSPAGIDCGRNSGISFEALPKTEPLVAAV